MLKAVRMVRWCRPLWFVWPIWASQLPDTGVTAEFYNKGALVQPIVALFVTYVLLLLQCDYVLMQVI